MIKSAIITGVGGFIGSHLCQRLLELGIIVYGIDINKGIHERFKSPLYNPVVANFNDYKNLHKIIPQEIEVFFHFAWSGGLLQESFWDYRLQMQNAIYACDAYIEASKIGCKKFINAGTNNQIEIKQFLASDNFNPRPTCIYASAKTTLDLICKTLALKSDTEYIGTMIPMPYGEGNRSMQLANVVMINLIKGNSPRLIEGNNLYDMIYIEDIVDAFIELSQKGINGKTYYIGHRKLKTFKEWIISIKDIINPNVTLKFGDYKDPLNLDYSLINLDLLYQDTGYECESNFETTIKSTENWIKKNLL